MHSAGHIVINGSMDQSSKQMVAGGCRGGGWEGGRGGGANPKHYLPTVSCLFLPWCTLLSLVRRHQTCTAEALFHKKISLSKRMETARADISKRGAVRNWALLQESWWFVAPPLSLRLTPYRMLPFSGADCLKTLSGRNAAHTKAGFFPLHSHP